MIDLVNNVVATDIEIWKDIKGFEDCYQVSNLGRVKSLEREVVNGKGFLLKPESYLNPYVRNVNKKEDGIVILHRSPQPKKVYKLKELVAEYFLDFIPLEGYGIEFYTVYFKDKNIENYKADNLYYDFNKNAVRVYDYEGYWLGDYPSTAKAEEATGVFQSSVLDIMNGTLLSTHGFQFRRLSKEQSIFKLPSLYLDKRGNTIPIAKYWNGRVVCVYNSMQEAADKNNIPDVRNIQGSVDRGTKVKGATYKKIS